MPHEGDLITMTGRDMFHSRFNYMYQTGRSLFPNSLTCTEMMRWNAFDSTQFNGMRLHPVPWFIFKTHLFAFRLPSLLAPPSSLLSSQQR